MNLVLFDFDGTLVDTVPAFAAAVRVTVPDPDSGGPSTKKIQQILAEASSYDEIFEALRESDQESEGESASPSAGEIEEAFHEAYPTHGKLYPGVYRLLMALEDQAVCGIVGSAPQPLLDEMIGYFGLDGYIAHASATVEGKTSLREAIHAWMNEANLSPHEAYWVSSRPVQLAFAHDMDIRTVFAAYGYGTHPSFSVDQRLDRLSGLFRLFS